MEEQLRRAQQRREELEKLLQDPGITSDRSRFASLSREYAELQEAHRLSEELRVAERARDETMKVASTTNEAELRTLATHEIAELGEKSKRLRERIMEIVEPPDPNDRKDIIVEIRSGAGGDEAALFAAELFRMYHRFAERRGWKSQLVSESRTSLGGFKEVIFELTGGPIYRDLKYESGVHRVQRVPETEKSGRVHTSTVTVVVLPEADEVEITLDPKDLEMTATTSSGHGGQSVNTTYSAIRILHKPTGIVVSCQDERSQLQNREKALRILRSRLLAHELEQRQREASTKRKSLIGSGDRSEKIRTYNVPQDRITDHRIKKSFHGIHRILDGEIDGLIAELQQAERSLTTHPRP